MIDQLPSYISLVFIVVTLLTLLLLFKASGWNKWVWMISIVWLLLQGVAGLMGFYTVTNTVPPRLILLAGPAVIGIVLLFATARGRRFIDGFDVSVLTYLHAVRVPVEIVLLWLFVYKQVPQLMTFEGRNFDILSGLSAPLIAYYAYKAKKLNAKVMLIWNVICVGLLFNIVINAILSAPSAFQKFAFDQPNVGLLYFPFVWLPCFVVPVVLFSHLICIRKTLR